MATDKTIILPVRIHYLRCNSKTVRYIYKIYLSIHICYLRMNRAHVRTYVRVKERQREK